MMRAVVFRHYGEPRQVMELAEDQQVPVPKNDEVLLKVEAASVNAADRHMVRANYLIVRLLLGVLRPAEKNRILGMDVAGTIQTLGASVEGFQIGDAVAADIRRSFGGGFAEYATVKAADLVKKPDGVSFAEAATVPISGQAAMMGALLCDIEQGDKVLIVGASGGVGSFAVQIAKALGAHVTALSSPAKVDTVRSWGADVVLDSTKEGVSGLPSNTYDAVFDAACFGSPKVFSRPLKDDGRYVLVGGSYYNMLRVKLFGRWYAQGNQKFRGLTQEVEVTTNIRSVFELITQGKVKPAIQTTVSLSEVADAIHCLDTRTVVGKIVVQNQL